MPSERILFHAGAKVRLIKGKGAPIGKGHLLAIFIKQVRVDPRAFRSKDFGPNREGVLELTVATEKTVIPFSGLGPIQAKYLQKVAYLGRNPGGIGFSVGILESDEESRRKLDKASNVAAPIWFFARCQNRLGTDDRTRCPRLRSDCRPFEVPPGGNRR